MTFESLPEANAEIERLREELADLESTFSAWFDLKHKIENDLGKEIKGSFAGYLRTCRSGGMSSSDSDIAESSMDLFVDLYLGSTILPFVTSMAEDLSKGKGDAQNSDV